MHIIPALDLRDGTLIQRKGSSHLETTDRAPRIAALQYVAQGFDWLHIFDHDGVNGQHTNISSINSILSDCPIPVQIAGGIKTMSKVNYWLEAGATRIVLDSTAILDEGFAKSAVQTSPERVVGLIEIQDGELVCNRMPAPITLDQALGRMTDAGFETVMVLDQDRHGKLTGANVNTMRDITHSTPFDILVAGGVTAQEDITALSHLSPRMSGVVVGRAAAEGYVLPKSNVA